MLQYVLEGIVSPVVPFIAPVIERDYVSICTGRGCIFLSHLLHLLLRGLRFQHVLEGIVSPVPFIAPVIDRDLDSICTGRDYISCPIYSTCY